MKFIIIFPLLLVIAAISATPLGLKSIDTPAVESSPAEEVAVNASPLTEESSSANSTQEAVVSSSPEEPAAVETVSPQTAETDVPTNNIENEAAAGAVGESSQDVIITEEESDFISSGSYTYKTPDGRLLGFVTVSWIANEARLHAAGDHKPSTSLNQLPDHVSKILAEFEAAADAVSVIPRVSTEVTPVESSPETSPIESSPVESVPLESDLIESSPAAESSPESSPVESSPESVPVESSPESSPVESSPVESSPVESSPVDSSNSISAL